MEDEDSNVLPTDYCSICGFALYPDHKQITLSGQFVDYYAHECGTVNFTICVSCWEAIMEIGEGGTDRAMARATAKLRALESLDKEDIKEMEEKEGYDVRSDDTHSDSS